MAQESGESLSAFLVRLKSSATNCDFDDIVVDTLVNQLVRDQYIRGITEMKIVESLLAQKDLTLAHAVEIAEGIDQASKDTQSLSHQGNSLLAINRRDASNKSEPPANRSRDVVCHTCGK